MLQVVSRIVNLLSRSSADSTRACARVEFLCFPLTPSHRGEGSEACISSPRKPNGLSHGIFECLIVEASSQAQNHLSVLADRYTERCRSVFQSDGLPGAVTPSRLRARTWRRCTLLRAARRPGRSHSTHSR